MTLLPACGGDPCRSLCQDVARKMDQCLDGWGYTWEDLGAESRAGYRTTCTTEWESIRADLEARQIPDAEARCDDGATTLDDLTCDELWILYF